MECRRRQTEHSELKVFLQPALVKVKVDRDGEERKPSLQAPFGRTRCLGPAPSLVELALKPAEMMLDLGTPTPRTLRLALPLHLLLHPYPERQEMTKS